VAASLERLKHDRALRSYSRLNWSFFASKGALMSSIARNMVPVAMSANKIRHSMEDFFTSVPRREVSMHGRMMHGLRHSRQLGDIWGRRALRIYDRLDTMHGHVAQNLSRAPCSECQSEHLQPLFHPLQIPCWPPPQRVTIGCLHTSSNIQERCAFAHTKQRVHSMLPMSWAVVEVPEGSNSVAVCNVPCCSHMWVRAE
jgi:hypothetical protein